MAVVNLNVDHVLIAVRDLDLAAMAYRRLGFTVTPEGVHPGRGTKNRLVVFGNEYLELISISDPTVSLFRPNMAKFLESREGLFIFSIGTDDIKTSFRKIRSHGIKIAEPMRGFRTLEDGDVAYSWWQAEIERTQLPGSQTFLIQHDHTVEERHSRLTEPWNHSNGAVGVHHLTLVVPDARKASGYWRDLFQLNYASVGAAPNEDANKVGLTFGNCILEFLSPTRPGTIQDFLSGNGDGPFSLAIKVAGLNRTADYLINQNVAICDLEYDGSSGFSVNPVDAQGVSLVFLQA